MEKKYWKVYAKCCIIANPIQEVDEEELDICIHNDIKEFGNFPDDENLLPFDPIFDKIYDSYHDKMMNFFNENGWLDFGDFRIVYCSADDDLFYRPNICGYTAELILD